MPKKRSPILFIFACFMIFVGVAILLYPIVGNRIAQHHRNQSVVEYQREMKALPSELRAHYMELSQRYNEFIFDRQQGNPFEYVSYEELSSQTVQVMGTIDVPALGIRNLPFYHGTAYETLMMGLGHFELSSIPIGGENTRGVITGHSGIHNQLLFTEINRLQVGDIFFVNILGERLAYEIESFEEILPVDVERAHVVPGHDMVTLLTCWPPGINTYRLLANGFRIPYEEAIVREVTVRNFWNYQRIVLGTLALIVLLFTVSYLYYRNLRKKSLSNDEQVAVRAARRLRLLIKTIKVLFMLLLISCLVVLGVAIAGYVQMQGAVQIGEMNIGVEGEMRDYNLFKITKANYEEGQIASVNISNYSDALSATWETINNWGIGRILLPDSNIDLPILAGLDNNNLLTGGSTYRSSQQMGRDNYVLLAHSIYNNDEVLFQPLYFTQIGEHIYMTDFENVFTYEVFLNQVVLDTEVQFIKEIEEGETPIITLLRCEGNIGTVYRRVVQGALINVEPLDAGLLAAFDLVKEPIQRRDDGESNSMPMLLANDPISSPARISMNLASQILTDPIQVALPLFLILVFPIIFLSMLPKEKVRH